MFSSKRMSLCLFVGVALVLSVLMGAPAQPVQIPNPFKGKQAVVQPRPQNEIVQHFPSNDVMKTAWKVHWATQRGYGLIIQDAFFKRSPTDNWMQVLGDARVSEIFVPYHSGNPRFWDVAHGFPLCAATVIDAGPNGQLLGNPPTVVQELKDRGIIWVDSQRPRRGQTMLLRGVLLAANYRYLIEYGFQDDGAITFRLGATGHNFASREWEPHMHGGLWRIDVNLGGPHNNSVYVMEHQEPDGQPAKAKSIHKPFNGGLEGFLDWSAEKFTMLRVVNDNKKNLRGETMGYDLVPQRMGNARHFNGPKEDCTQHDFWVTAANPKELYYYDLPKYVANAEPIMNADVVLWHAAAAHHEPRSEDGEMKGRSLVGVTHVMWTGFDLRPRNIFDRTPLYP